MTLEEFTELVEAFERMGELSGEWRRRVIGSPGRPAVLWTMFNLGAQKMKDAMEAIEPPGYNCDLAE